ncbi:DAHL domain-containing protein [Oceanicoccus sagamiensis]|nr:DAHL domain-containing protein [Oceanicoccus sagamiensis]
MLISVIVLIFCFSVVFIYASDQSKHSAAVNNLDYLVRAKGYLKQSVFDSQYGRSQNYDAINRWVGKVAALTDRVAADLEDIDLKADGIDYGLMLEQKSDNIVELVEQFKYQDSIVKSSSIYIGRKINRLVNQDVDSNKRVIDLASSFIDLSMRPDEKSSALFFENYRRLDALSNDGDARALKKQLDIYMAATIKQKELANVLGGCWVVIIK